jgi:hypothetical protein
MAAQLTGAAAALVTRLLTRPFAISELATVRAAILILASCAAFASSAFADPASDFEAALQKWRSADVKSYSFLYEDKGAVLFAPKCADAKIRVTVRNGVSTVPVVFRSGNSKCPRWTRGKKAIGMDVPATIDEAFAQIHRYILEPPVESQVHAKYDATWGIPLTFFVTKALSDNDEGFAISDFKRLE